MLNTTHPQQARTRISVTLIPGSFPVSMSMEISAPCSLPQAEASFPFSVSAIALCDHPRVNAWAGLAEAGQILSEAEAHKGGLLSQEELRAVMDAHLDAYDPTWSFGRGITEAWLTGWSQAFALYSRQIARSTHPEPIHGSELLASDSLAEHATASALPAEAPPQTVRFRKASLQVRDPEAFWEGVWQGQYNAQTLCSPLELWAAMRSAEGLPAVGPVTVAWCFDELLDLFTEAGNHGMEFVVGYTLGLCEGLLCGRINPPVRIQAEHASASSGLGENS